MEITEVRIKLMEESEDRLRAFCSITIDHCFVIRDLKIIEGTNGPFVAMPSRKMSARCGRCGNKNHLRSQYCNQCGSRLRGPQDLREVEGGNPNKLYADIAHPINQACRDLIQSSVIGEYMLELERAKLPGYKSRYDDEYADSGPEGSEGSSVPPSGPAPASGGHSIPKPHMLEPPSSSTSKRQDKRHFGDGIFEG
ncbi:MAG: septation protein SpoVG family protein [Pirellula sp.]|nr:septation protein SpoVG family protein [Pirellula sp.]